MAAPVLTNLSASVTLAENTVNVTPQLLDSSVTLTDTDGNFNGGTLTVTGLLTEDTVSIRHQGTGAGQIGFNSATKQITFAGIVIGAAAGGTGTTLTITFTAAATALAIETLIERLTYDNSSDTPTAARTLTVTVKDAAAESGSGTIVVNVTAESDIQGTSRNDLVDATHTVAGQPLPTAFNDIINGRSGNDDLSGLAGNDIINGGDGRDTLRGGDGDDTFVVRSAEGTRDLIEGGTGTDTLQLSGSNPVTLHAFDASASSVEVLFGNGAGISGTAENDTVDLSGLTTMFNVPFINGLKGNDTLIGSKFADDLRGAEGNDTLDGRAGTDKLRGGDGADAFIFATGYGQDTILDYKSGFDTIDLTGVANVHSFANLHLTQTNPTTVLIDFDGVAGGDTLTVQKTTIAILTANQADFLFS